MHGWVYSIWLEKIVIHVLTLIVAHQKYRNACQPPKKTSKTIYFTMITCNVPIEFAIFPLPIACLNSFSSDLESIRLLFSGRADGLFLYYGFLLIFILQISKTTPPFSEHFIVLKIQILLKLIIRWLISVPHSGITFDIKSISLTEIIISMH